MNIHALFMSHLPVWLQVFSGFRFIRTAAEVNKPIAIVNIGDTRGDNLASLKIHAKCGDILPLIRYDN